MYIPSNIQNYEDLKMEPPSEKLELDWVYPSSHDANAASPDSHTNTVFMRDSVT